jgi:hypothetical protein
MEVYATIARRNTILADMTLAKKAVVAIVNLN